MVCGRLAPLACRAKAYAAPVTIATLPSKLAMLLSFLDVAHAVSVTADSEHAVAIEISRSIMGWRGGKPDATAQPRGMRGKAGATSFRPARILSASAQIAQIAFACAIHADRHGRARPHSFDHL
jgi:hypothetical protein